MIEDNDGAAKAVETAIKVGYLSILPKHTAMKFVSVVVFATPVCHVKTFL